VVVRFSDDPSLNTQSCIKGLQVVQDFCFRPFGQPNFAKSSIYFLRWVFYVFKDKMDEKIDFLYMVGSALKSCIR
jgi:hypothetical protein